MMRQSWWKCLATMSLAAVIVCFGANQAFPQEKDKEPEKKKGAPGRGGFMRQPGQIMSSFMQERLGLTEEQKKELAELQKTVDEKLGKLLTEEQKTKMKEMAANPFGGRPGFRPGGEQGKRRPGSDKKRPDAEKQDK